MYYELLILKNIFFLTHNDTTIPEEHCSRRTSMTYAHYSARGFDWAMRASGIVLMKPFSSQTPSVFPLFALFPAPAMMQREKNFRLMAQIMELPRRKDHHVWLKRYSGREESEKGRKGTMSPIDGNFTKTWNSFIIFGIKFHPLCLGGFRTGYVKRHEDYPSVYALG